MLNRRGFIRSIAAFAASVPVVGRFVPKTYDVFESTLSQFGNMDRDRDVFADAEFFDIDSINLPIFHSHPYDAAPQDQFRLDMHQLECEWRMEREMLDT